MSALGKPSARDNAPLLASQSGRGPRGRPAVRFLPVVTARSADHGRGIDALRKAARAGRRGQTQELRAVHARLAEADRRHATHKVLFRVGLVQPAGADDLRPAHAPLGQPVAHARVARADRRGADQPIHAKGVFKFLELVLSS